jgi:uncharacterized protein YyaL (SSP411 family)
MHRNRLAVESSCYLRQHADNPVDWYAWSREALDAARLSNKPILLSVGYSACHWCHVMAHESFEDPAIAALMNARFINVKVDREERPDIDQIYQKAQQLLTRRGGGWPLTMFLSPEDQRPFFGGTYFPKEARHGLPGFADLLTRVADYWAEHAAEIRAQNAELMRAFERLEPPAPAPDLELDAAPLLAGRQALAASADRQHGGFGRAPKFPHPGHLERCLRYWHATAHGDSPDLEALYLATLTLTRMAEGGIYDQLGGGFARYSVDDLWRIPHFEKMLYDNGALLYAYAAAALATGDPFFKRIAAETADWMIRDLGAAPGSGTTPGSDAQGGGFYSSLDADSEGHEGQFYVWDRAEVRALLNDTEYAAFAPRYGLDQEPNFDGRWNLYIAAPLPDAAQPEAAAIASARAKLLAARERRIPPARDEKILTAWNALAIKGLALAGRVLERPDLIDAATRAVDFIRGRPLPAYLDDYAFLVDALLELLQCRWRGSDLSFALELIDGLRARFEDREHGGFFFTAADQEALIHRTKSFGDESIPAGNGIAAAVLCRLGLLLGDLGYLEAAERTLQAGWAPMAEFPLGHMSLLNALEEFLTSPQIVIIRGSAAESTRWARSIQAIYAPLRLVFAIPGDAADLPPALASKRLGSANETLAYLCQGMTCGPPLRSLEELARALAAHRVN